MTIPRCILSVFLLAAIVLASGCSQSGPEKVAEAANDMATLEEVVDPSVIDDVMMGILFQAGLQAFVGGGSAEVMDLETKVLSKTDARATVHVTGDMKTNVLGTSLITPLDVQLELVKIDGSWYVTD